MRYCHNCHHITPGEALFCGRCGRSYGVKLCPRLHANSRETLVCSQCGSPDLSRPAPQVPVWGKALEVILDVVPGSLFGLLAVVLVIGVVNAVLSSAELVHLLFGLALMLGVLWYGLENYGMSKLEGIGVLNTCGFEVIPT